MKLNFVQEIINQLRLHLNKDLILQHFNKFIQLQYYKNHIKTLVSESNLFTEIKELKHCKIIDLYNSNLFEQEDFGDWDHLNENGAKKLSNYVRNLIEVDNE